VNKIFILLITIGLASYSHAKPFDNPCGVVSSFTPNKDVTVYVNTNVLFTNTSTNAQSVTWYVNGNYFGVGNTQFIGFSIAGSYKIMLVAKNGSCFDTSYCYYIMPGIQPPNRNNIEAYYGFPNIEDKVKGIVGTSDGGYLIAGNTSLYATYIPPYHGESGLLVKVSSAGCMEWTKVMKSKYYGDIQSVYAFPDSTYGVIGQDDVPYARVYDSGGNLIWNRNFKKNGSYLPMKFMAQTADKGYVLATPTYGGLNVLKLDANANITWSRLLYKSIDPSNHTDYLNPSIVVKDNYVYIATTAFEYIYMADSKVDLLLTKMDVFTGQTKWCKTVKVNGTFVYTRNLSNRGTGLVLNTTIPTADNNLIYLDTAGNVLDSRTISAPNLNKDIITSVVKVRANGDLYLFNQGSSPLPLQPYIAYAANCVLLDKDFNLKWSRSYSGSANGRMFYHDIGNDGTFAVVGEKINAAIPVYSYGRKIQLKKMDTLAPVMVVSGCSFYNFPLNVGTSSSMVEDYALYRDSAFSLQANDTAALILDSYAQVRYTCPTEFVDSCSFLSITGPGAICNIASTYTYKVHRNKACNQPVTWQVAPAANIISQSDTAIVVRFPTFGSYVVSALLPYSCTPIKDSVRVSVASNTATLFLGNDTTLCPSNTLMVDAGPRFYSYLWQDGSTQRTFTITAPGTYWVKAVDSCNNIFRDTIQVALTASVPINAGPDRTKCNSDTLHLSAPTGFLGYQWSPNYQIGTVNAPMAVVNPLVDTAYFLKAEKTPGCFAFDTVQIRVYKSALIALGNDTSICTNTSIVLDAGSGFNNYQWSNGSLAAQTNVGTPGIYSVIATDSHGCKSYDTLKLISLYALPTVTLSKDTVLCMGGSLLLDAGAGYKNYVWSNGNNTQTVSISTVGNTQVTVTDMHGCQGTGNQSIKAIVPLPTGFLPADMQICAYDKAILKTGSPFEKYSWSTGATSPTITVASGGIYWLQVTDRNKCIGFDTMAISIKDCIKGAYFPTAFTPDRNGQNDRFMPLLYGMVTNYKLVVYNRYGETVFSSSDPTKSWDGAHNGIAQPAGTYVFQCDFRFAGMEKASHKGTVVLIR